MVKTNKVEKADMKNQFIITQQSNGLFSIYTDTGEESMADEKLVNFDLTIQDAEAKVAYMNEYMEVLPHNKQVRAKIHS